MLRIFLGSHLKVVLKVELWFFNELGHRFVILNWRTGGRKRDVGVAFSGMQAKSKMW